MSRAQEVLQLVEEYQLERIDEFLGRAIKAGLKAGILGYVGWKVGKRVVGASRGAGKTAILAWADRYGVSPDIARKILDSGIPLDQLIR